MNILRKRGVATKVGLSGVHIMRLVRRGAFPEPLRLGPASIGWLESEVDQWLEQKAEQRFVRRPEAESSGA